jgi:transketolase
MKQFKLGTENLKVFSATVQELAERDTSVYVVTSDSRGSGRLVPFGEAFPDRIIEVGIAEQNLVGVAAGLASTGKIVFAVSPACFLTARALEQIKNDVAYSDNPVNLIGISAGVSYGALGSTHHAIHDFAALRAIHNMIIIAPADNYETRQAILAAAKTEHPVYVRMGKRPMEHLVDPETPFQIGKSIQLRDGHDVAFIACGETVYPAAEAAELLSASGIQSRVISMHTVKPLDQGCLLKAAQECNAIVTVEEHSIFGGLGEACASVLLQAGAVLPFKIVGIPDEYTVTGKQLDILSHYHISGKGLAGIAQSLLSTC